MVMYGYYEYYDRTDDPKRKKRKRVNELDPNASKADKRYKDNYGL